MVGKYAWNRADNNPRIYPSQVQNSQIELYERVYSWSNGYFPDEIVSRGKTLVSDMRLIAHIDGKMVKLNAK